MGLFSSSLSVKDMAGFCHSLSMLYESGVPMVRAFKALEESGGGRSTRALARDLRQDIEQGATLGQAVEWRRKRLSPVFVSMIAIGERTGNLGRILPQLTRYYEDLRGMYLAVIRQVSYPIALILAIAVGIPILKAFLSDVAGVADAPFERQLLWILREFGLDVGGILIAAVLLTRLTLLVTTRESVLMYCWPIAGIVRRILLSRFAWAMMIYTRAGLPLHEAIVMSGEVTGARKIARDFERLGPLLRTGFTLEEALTQSRFFPKKNMVWINTGEHTGMLDENLERLSRMLYDEAVFKLKVLIGLIEPLAILIIGGMIVATM